MTNLARSVSICILAAAIGTPELNAWGNVGHRTVGRFAARHLNQKARERIAAILGVAAAPGAVEDAMAGAAIWPDQVARTRFKASIPYHFLDLSLRNGARDIPDPFGKTALSENS